jgi:hypothetical protein
VEELIRAVGPDAKEIHSTRRQLQRWVEFFPDVRKLSAEAKKQVTGDDWHVAMELANQIFEKMPVPLPFS